MTDKYDLEAMGRKDGFVALFFALPGLTSADIYMHNPRGSNDRNCERNVNRNNGNRLFDSQNNAAGGYACPRAVGDETVQNEDGIASFGNGDQSMRLYFYENSTLPIEWTNQHGCGMNSKVNCEIVIQYMCEDTADPQVDNFWPWTETKGGNENDGLQAFRSGDYIAAPRDGIPTSATDDATTTIPDTLDAAIPDTAADRRYGMHESYDFYQLCQKTKRNKGLYTADQNVRRNDQRGTRQNPNGNRRGLECPEERDYYPWWHPSPWVDVAVLTNDAGDMPCQDPIECETQRCKYYLENSFNKNQKGYCDVLHTSSSTVQSKTQSLAWARNSWYNNREDCEAAGFHWYMVALDEWLDLDYPVCQRTAFSRINHLGNSYDSTISGSKSVPNGLNANRFLWNIPAIPTINSNKTSSDYFAGHNGNGLEDAYMSCTLRIRYNISTSDFPAWPVEAMEDGHPWKYEMVDSRNNSDPSKSENPQTPLEQDPYIYVGAGDSATDKAQFVSLAVNTNQYARTFQDRSYKFAIKPRPAVASSVNNVLDRPSIPVIPSSANVFNVNVRGKRGNIVQTYPSVEYDFVPNSLSLESGDFVHFQWTGSDYNPRRGCNDAEGGPPDPNDFVSSSRINARADRSNIVFMDYMADNQPMDYLGFEVTGEDDDAVAYASHIASMKLSMLNNTPCFDSLDDTNCFDQLVRLAYLNQQSDGGALSLRRGRECLTVSELDEIANKQERENHPLNCAKLNAKPYPYFDGGVMKVDNPGSFTFFSSRNNNFSNRDQTGFICVKGERAGQTFNCSTDKNTGILQGKNLGVSSATTIARPQAVPALCEDEASSSTSANDQGASSCLTTSTASTLSEETFTIEQAANDAIGDGEETSCEQIIWFINPGSGKNVTEEGIAVAMSIIGVGAFWAAIYVYNRLRKKQEGEGNDLDAEFNKSKWLKQSEKLSADCI